ncbi:MAG: FecR domain-containing protein [Candidatus Marinimicrobia bacterium]|nr:FecR domain-containing protein [Candidatus Neomarinimicrobiota bacterium]MCF7904666.1 FecR domain-containing protein [Candidatus Neomarinimicrobiota bacterium]
MKKLAALLLSTLLATGVFAEKVAIVSKANGEVLLRNADAQTFNQPAVKGTILEINDRVRVNEGFAVALLLDDQSQFKLRENTEVAFTMVKDLSGTSYHLRLDYGQALTNFTPVPGTSFNIHTPTSVVSVKGTSFWTVSDPDAGDNVIVLEGEVSVMNSLTGTTSTATAGQSIRSTPDGNVQSAPTEAGSIPEDPDPDDSFGAITPTPDAPDDASGQAEPVEPQDEESTKRNRGLILGLMMVLLVAALL